MRLGLDTSVTLRLLTGVPEDLAERARALLATAEEPVQVSDLVVSETWFALRHHYAVPHAEALRALLALLSDERVQATGVAVSALDDALNQPHSRAAVSFMDRLIRTDYSHHDTQLVTFDRALGRLDGVRYLGREGKGNGERTEAGG